MTTYISPSITMQSSSTTYSLTIWRAWAQEMMDAFTAVGLVQTSDTGQLVPSTATPGGVSTTTGYQMWRFSDAAQATDPVFLKIGFGRSGNSTTPRLTIQVGQGSNGSLTLTGITTLEKQIQSAEMAYNGTNFTGQHYAYFGNGVFWIGDCFYTTEVNSFNNLGRGFGLVARSRDTSGALDGRGIIQYTGTTGASSDSSAWLQFCRWISGDTKAYGESAFFTFCPGMRTDSSYSNGDKMAWPFWYYDNGVRQFEMLWFTDVANLALSPTQITASPYGRSRNWLSYKRTPRASFRIGAYTGQALSATDLNNYHIVVPWD